MSSPLEEIAAVVDCEHRTAPAADPGEEFGYSVGTRDLKGGKALLNQAKRVSYETFLSWTGRAKPEEGDLILGREAPVGEVALIDGRVPICLGQRTVLIKPDRSRVDPRYLHAWLRAPAAQDWIHLRSEGSTVKHINVADVRKLPIVLPRLSEQRRIAGVLGALDDLIDTNEQLMRQLDEISIGLFLDAWDGETWCEIQDLGTITMGQSPPGSALSEDPAGIPFFQGVRDFGVRFPAERIFTTDSKRFADKGAILIAVRAPVGQTNVALKYSSIGRGLAALDAVEPSIALRALRATAETWAAHQDTGTVFSSINGTELRQAKVPRVENSQLAKMLQTFDEQFAALHLEVENLRRTRDELLPLLMSGKIQVREAEEVISAALKGNG